MSQDLDQAGSATPPAATGSGDQPIRLRGNMGAFQLIFLVLAMAAPVSVMAGFVPLGIAFGSGMATPLVFVLLGLIMATFAVGYLLMSRKMPRSGAFYTFVTAGLGRPLGLSTSFVAILSYTLGMLGVYAFIGISLQATLPVLPWWAWTLISIAVVAVLGYVQIDVSAKIMAVLLIAGFALVLVYDIVVIANGSSGGTLTFDSFNPVGVFTGGGATIIGIALLITAVTGFEATAIYADEVKDRRKTIPRAAYGSILIITVFFTLGSWAIIQAFGGTAEGVGVMGIDPATAFLTSMAENVGTVAFHLMGVMVLLGSVASALGMHNVISRYLFNLGIDRVLPAALGRPHPRFGSPYVASLSLSIVTLVIYVVATVAVPAGGEGDFYAVIIGLMGLGLIVLLALSAIGIAAYLLRTKPTDVNVWQRAIAPVIAAVLMVALLFGVWINIDMITGGGILSVLSVVLPIVAIAAGVLVALIIRKARPDVYQHIGTRE